MDQARSSTSSGLRAEMFHCSFTFSVHGRIPGAVLQSIMGLGFKVSKDKNGLTCFDKTNPSRISIISLFHMIGFDDSVPGSFPNNSMSNTHEMPSLESYAFCGSNSSASFEILSSARGMEMTELQGNGNDLYWHELDVDIPGNDENGEQNSEEKIDAKDCEKHEGKRGKAEKIDTVKRPSAFCGSNSSTSLHELDVDFSGNDEKREQSSEDFQIIHNRLDSKQYESSEDTTKEEVQKKTKMAISKNIAKACENYEVKRGKAEKIDIVRISQSPSDEQEEEETGEEEVSRFVFQQSVYELFCERFKNSRTIKCITVTHESNGRIIVSLKDDAARNDVIKFQRSVHVKKGSRH